MNESKPQEHEHREKEIDGFTTQDTRKIQREPKLGDMLRLVRVPAPETQWIPSWGNIGDKAKIVAIVSPQMPVVRLSSGLAVWWPLSCTEIVGQDPASHGGTK